MPFPGQLTDVSLTLREEMTEYEWGAVLDMLGCFARGLPWHIADAYLHGEQKFGERAPQIAERLGMTPQAIMSMLWVARRFPKCTRRAALSQSHHALVAMLDDPMSTYFLNLATENNWTTEELRKEIAKIRHSKRVLDGKDG